MAFNFDTALGKALEAYSTQIEHLVDIGNYMAVSIVTSTSDLIGRRLTDEEYNTTIMAYKSVIDLASHKWCAEADKMLKQHKNDDEKGGKTSEKP